MIVGEVCSMSEETEVKQEVTPAEQSGSMADFEDRLDPDKFDAPVWDKFHEMMEKKEVFTVTVKGVVNGGLVAYVDDIRAFIPKSHVARNRVDDLNPFLGKELEVRIIESEQAGKKLILSAREVIRDRDRKNREDAVNSVSVGTVTTGKVETLQPYGAFVRLENGLSGLVHVSQISTKRVKTPADVLKVGDEVNVKVIAVKDGKLSLSMKALLEKDGGQEEYHEREKIVLPKTEKLSTNLGDLLKDIKL